MTAALAVLPATPAEVATLRRACNATAARHARTHAIDRATLRCLAVPHSGMGAGACKAIATAAYDRRVLHWSWSPALHRLLFHESTWNPNAVNDASEACGLFQRLVKPSQSPGRGCPWKVSGVGTSRERVHTTALVQAVNGLKYIAERPGYGTPEAALAFWNANGWY